MKESDFTIRGLELHSLYAWDYNWIISCLDFMQQHKLNTLVLHRNDFIDLIVYPGKYFGCDDTPNESIFDRYRQIFRSLYRYTPTRRSGPYQRRAFLKRVLHQAQKRDIAVYIENKELFFPDIILEFYPHLVKNGKICATDPFWWEFINEKYTELFEEFPEIAGIITAPATGESRVSISSNRCTCERCASMGRAQWFDTLLRTMYEPIKKAGRRLIVRDFVFDPEAHHEIATAMQMLPEDVIISLKNTPHDYYPTFPPNQRIGNIGEREQWIEFDTMGQYFGWGVGIADLFEDYRWRMEDAKKKGATGVIFRTDWESLDGHTVFRSSNFINLFSAAALAHSLNCDKRSVYHNYLEEQGWFDTSASEIERELAVMWFIDIMSKTWSITRHTPFVDDHVFSDSSLMPISYEHAFWLAEEKNSLSAWVPEKKVSLEPTWSATAAAIAEKEEALQNIERLVSTGSNWPIGISPLKGEAFLELLKVNRLYVRSYLNVTKALFLTRYVLETSEDRAQDQYLQAKEQLLPKSLQTLEKMEGELHQFHKSTDFVPHVIYTLLDPDRVSCLRRDLIRQLDKVGISWK